MPDNEVIFDSNTEENALLDTASDDGANDLLYTEDLSLPDEITLDDGKDTVPQQDQISEFVETSDADKIEIGYDVETEQFSQMAEDYCVNFCNYADICNLVEKVGGKDCQTKCMADVTADPDYINNISCFLMDDCDGMDDCLIKSIPIDSDCLELCGKIETDCGMFPAGFAENSVECYAWCTGSVYGSDKTKEIIFSCAQNALLSCSLPEISMCLANNEAECKKKVCSEIDLCDQILSQFTDYDACVDDCVKYSSMEFFILASCIGVRTYDCQDIKPCYPPLKSVLQGPKEWCEEMISLCTDIKIYFTQKDVEFCSFEMTGISQTNKNIDFTYGAKCLTEQYKKCPISLKDAFLCLFPLYPYCKDYCSKLKDCLSEKYDEFCELKCSSMYGKDPLSNNKKIFCVINAPTCEDLIFCE
jgi:hypothetical protein